jgi:hypothetical protein
LRFRSVSSQLQDKITQDHPESVLHGKAISEGIPLRQDGWGVVIGGFTTIEEVMHVTAANLA